MNFFLHNIISVYIIDIYIKLNFFQENYYFFQTWQVENLFDYAQINPSNVSANTPIPLYPTPHLIIYFRHLSKVLFFSCLSLSFFFQLFILYYLYLSFFSLSFTLSLLPVFLSLFQNLEPIYFIHHHHHQFKENVLSNL